MLGQEREDAPRGQQIPRDRLNVQQLPLATSLTLHARTIANPRRTTAAPGGSFRDLLGDVDGRVGSVCT